MNDGVKTCQRTRALQVKIRGQQDICRVRNYSPPMSYRPQMKKVAKPDGRARVLVASGRQWEGRTGPPLPEGRGANPTRALLRLTGPGARRREGRGAQGGLSRAGRLRRLQTLRAKRGSREGQRRRHGQHPNAARGSDAGAALR